LNSRRRVIVYPLGLLSAAVVFDVIYLVTGNPTWATVSFWMIAAGIVGGWLGGELVERLGVSVTPDANLNAQNSLTHSPRYETCGSLIDKETECARFLTLIGWQFGIHRKASR
jgi:hypothetical protein